MQLLGNDPLPLAVSVEDFGQAMPWIEADNNDTVEGYLRAAQEVVEVASRRPLTERQVQIEFNLRDANGFQCWYFPFAPVKEVSAVTIAQPFADDIALAADQFSLQRGFDEPQLWFSSAALALADPSRAQSVRVEATVGFEEGKALENLRHAIILLVKEWYDAGVSIGDFSEANLSFSVKALIKQRRYHRPKEFG